MVRKGWKGTYCFSKKCQVMHQKCAGKTYLEAKKIMVKRMARGWGKVKYLNSMQKKNLNSKTSEF